jgi:hypothetical protein
MPLTLTREQQDFMRNGTKVQNLAAWTLRSTNHIAVSVRQAASLNQCSTPPRRDIQHMADYLSGGGVSDSDLVRLINGFNGDVR